MRATETERKSIREGYRIIVTAETDVELSEDEKICEWNRKLAQTVLERLIEEGEVVADNYRNLPTHREQAVFQNRRGRYECRVLQEDERHTVLLSTLTWNQGNPALPVCRRYVQVWNRQEMTLLPPEQVRKYFGVKKSTKLPFAADGYYPKGNLVTAFRNASKTVQYCEKNIEK